MNNGVRSHYSLLPTPYSLLPTPYSRTPLRGCRGAGKPINYLASPVTSPVHPPERSLCNLL
ncbi:hypothetical protein [Moorena sp. SIO3I8]|uniref:hypothetical protein n=1 Tax=Moorena sp. SIO3I8 TaxID=2607833 RepID=UPI0013C0DA14|nr:hypothetical protein [Moorena sp. SIO3I8]NEO08765.1 hypothetical protein [Moorena sp. SIO3I8]